MKDTLYLSLMGIITFAAGLIFLYITISLVQKTFSKSCENLLTNK